jgi:hypothetical protein
MTQYRIRFFFDWHCTPFWSGNEEAKERFDYAIQPEKLPLLPETIEKSYELASWHDKSLNWDYPPDPGPWRQEECERFNAAANQLIETVRAELGEAFELVNECRPLNEDPGLEEYLRNPRIQKAN